MLVRASRRWVAASSTVFPGIEFERDDPQSYKPAPLRIDRREDDAETIEEQSRGSARRLLRDRFVEDGGYLQSRSPFPLRAPRWEELDPDRPKMTAEGMLWEDMHHYVDYLTCRDVALAYNLNEMLLHRPNKILHQFEILTRVMHRPLCNHELMGRGYVFSREPVLSPSDLVGQLVLDGQMERLSKGMAYLWILDADLIEHQRHFVHGMDLARIQRSSFLLLEALEKLHASMAWTEAHFVQTLKEVAVFYPNAASTLHLLDSSFVLVELLLYKKEMMTRFVELRRVLWSPFRGMKLLNEMGRCPHLLLHEEESVFQKFKAWLPTFKSAGFEWREALQMCFILHRVWKSTSDSIDAFVDRAEKLYNAVPKAFLKSLEDCLSKDNEEEWTKEPLAAILLNGDQVIQRWQEMPAVCRELAENVPVLLTYEMQQESLKRHLDILREKNDGMDLKESIGLAEWIRLEPTIIQDPVSCVDMCDRIWPVIADMLTPDETATILARSTPACLAEAVRKLDAIICCLQDSYGLEKVQIKDLFKQKIERVRCWQRHAPFPAEIISLLQSCPAPRLAEILLMAIDDFKALEEQLFVLFGASASSIFSNLVSIPELLLDKDTLNDAISVARCFKVRRTDLRNVHFRKADASLVLLIRAFQLTKKRADLNQQEVLEFLERLSEMQLFAGDVSDLDPLSLAQFCTLCVEHLGAWEQFASLMSRIHHPLLAHARPDEMQKMKKEAFRAILSSPEVFLIRILWDQMVQYLTEHQWTFAGLDVETTMATEPCLFYYAVQDKWRHTFDRNARKLFDAPRSNKRIRHRGKSIVDVRPVQDSCTD